MRTKTLIRLLAAFALLGPMVFPDASWFAKAHAQADASTSSLLSEVRRAFTLHGKPIPPEVFRDFGDGNIADSTDIWVTVDIEAAIGSNLYADDIKKEGDGWFSQTKVNRGINSSEQTAYKFIGATDNGLLVVIASYNGGGSGTFYTLHILDVAAARAFDLEGKLYRRINLTLLRNVILGDRWGGEVSVSRNSIRIVTTRQGPAGAGTPTTQTIAAERP